MPYIVALIFAVSSASLLFASKPNILILAVDDLRPELGCYGAEHMVTPNMDALAAASMQFDQAYTQQAVCLPARISLFTGMRPNSTGVHNLQTDFRKTIPDAVTLPQYFEQHGYQTIGMGKVLHGEKWREWTQWINTNNLPEVKAYHSPNTLAKIQELRNEAKAKGLNGRALRRYTRGPAYEWADAPDSSYHDGAMTDLAIKALSNAGEKPFFMVVGYKKPHLPFVAPKQYWDHYDFETIQLPDNYHQPEGAPRIALMSWGELRAYSGIPQAGSVDTETARRLIHGYYASVSFVDAQIGRLMNALKENGLAEDTIVVLWGDHGWKLGEHGMWCKHTNFEIDTRVPFLIKAPEKSFAGGRTDALVELLDLYPTLCELANLPIPEQCEGTSLMPLLKDPHAKWSELAYSQYPRERGITGFSVKSPVGRYTEWTRGTQGVVVAREYYDHRVDPHENKNVVEAAAYKLEIKRLSALMRRERNQ